MRSEEELGGEIGDGTRSFARIGGRSAYPAPKNPVAHSVGERHIVVVLGCKRRKFSLHVVEIVEKGSPQCVLAETGSIIFNLGRARAGNALGAHENSLLSLST